MMWTTSARMLKARHPRKYAPTPLSSGNEKTKWQTSRRLWRRSNEEKPRFNEGLASRKLWRLRYDCKCDLKSRVTWFSLQFKNYLKRCRTSYSVCTELAPALALVPEVVTSAGKPLQHFPPKNCCCIDQKSKLNRGYYTVARRYEFYVRVAKFNKSKRRESWRHWTIRHSQRWHTDNIRHSGPGWSDVWNLRVV